jgi:fucose 4-O-acetylase-like acetyltransferase
MKDISIILLKAICAIIIVINACHIMPFVDSLTNLLIPSLFMALGYFFKTDYWSNTRGYLSKRIKNIYIPFWAWSAVFVALHNILALIHFSTPEIWGWQETFQRLWNLTFGMFGYDPIVSSSFGLFRGMFVASIAFYFITLIMNTIFSKSSDCRIIEISLLFTILMTIWMTLSHLSIPIFPNSGYTEMMSIIFFGAGCLYHQYEEYFRHRSLLTLIMSFTLIGLSVFSPSNMTTEANFITFVSTLLGGVAGFCVLHHLSIILSKTNKRVLFFLEYVGSNWLYVVAFFPLAFKLVSIFHILFTDLEWNTLYLLPVASDAFSGVSLIYAIVGGSLPLLCIWGWKEADKRYDLTPINCVKYTGSGMLTLLKLIWKGIKFLGNTIWNSIKSIYSNITDIIKASNPSEE